MLPVTDVLRLFPYHDNYDDLTCMELDAILSVTSETRKIAFLGSGPLPLSSLCIADALGKRTGRSPAVIRNIDRDPDAIKLSSSLCQKLGPRASAMQFQCTDAATPNPDLWDFDVVYLAALVGRTREQKQQIIATIGGQMKPGALLIIRSSHSLRCLLYPVRYLVSNLLCRSFCLLTFVGSQRVYSHDGDEP